MNKIIISATELKLFENDNYLAEVHFGSMFHTVNQKLLDLWGEYVYSEVLEWFATEYYEESFFNYDEEKEEDFIRILDYCYWAYIEYIEYGKMKCQFAHELFEKLSQHFEYITFEVESELEYEYEHLGEGVNW